jgi:hypothetical protein
MRAKGGAYGGIFPPGRKPYEGQLHHVVYFVYIRHFVEILVTISLEASRKIVITLK